MRRRPTYRWRLRDVMADHGLFSTTALSPLLADRGIDLSPSQVHRLVTQAPERLSLPILAALCDIFGCTPADLIVIDVEDHRPQDRRRRRGRGPGHCRATPPGPGPPR